MEGASVEEQLVGAARSNNEHLAEQLLEGKSAEEIAKLVNTVRDPVGNGLLHLAAQNGSLHVLDLLLDQEGVEIDPRNRLMGNTPLHLATEFAAGPGNEQAGIPVMELLIEAGAQPDPRNNQGRKPIDLARGHPALVQILRGAQYAVEMEREAGAAGADGADGPADGDADGQEEPDEPGEAEEPDVPEGKD